ncbi:MAG: hypothetical protein NZ700_15695 [Gemmataceae bacterium]|nr:hypothetical protein [Gemmataceae bacterium]MDW8264011.1 hypothetical protein [Gemmataceae bacterium]
MGRSLRLVCLVMLLAIVAWSSHLAGSDGEVTKSLQGTWDGHVGRFGRNNRFQGEAMIVLTFTADTITGMTKQGRFLGEGKYTLDPAKKTIDVLGTKGDYRGETFRGTYALDGDTLQWATTRGGSRRATLPPEDDEDVVILVKRRR